MRTLYGLTQSPWTERARWALDHHGIAYTYREHLPMVGELLLRRKAKVKKASVPLLEDGSIVVMGSLAIARYAEANGRGRSLFPRGEEAEVERWVDVAERITNVGRAWFLTRSLADREVQQESLPPFVPTALRGALAITVAPVLQFIAKKYDVPSADAGEVTRTLVPLLESVRAKLGGRSTLVGDVFSYADIAVATSLQALEPAADATLGPRTRQAWSNPALATEFPELLAWRDGLRAKHR